MHIQSIQFTDILIDRDRDKKMTGEGKTRFEYELNRSSTEVSPEDNLGSHPKKPVSTHEVGKCHPIPQRSAQSIGPRCNPCPHLSQMVHHTRSRIVVGSRIKAQFVQRSSSWQPGVGMGVGRLCFGT